MEPARGPDYDRLQEMHGKLVPVVVQRDRRTPLALQKAMAIVPLVLCLLVLIVVGGISYVHDTCSDCNGADANGEFTDGFRTFSFVMAGIAVLALAGNLFAVIRSDMMWMTQSEVREKWYGHDVEDTDPFILAREGDFIQSRTTSNTADLHRMIDDAYDSIPSE
jgi:hypothetical protein